MLAVIMVVVVELLVQDAGIMEHFWDLINIRRSTRAQWIWTFDEDFNTGIERVCAVKRNIWQPVAVGGLNGQVGDEVSFVWSWSIRQTEISIFCAVNYACLPDQHLRWC